MSDVVGRLNEALRDRYRIERELGEGGMATVYLADDLKHERKVALKVLKPELAAAVGAERFLAEIKTTANLQHPHILPLFDSGEADSFLFYVMPYVQGESLRDRLDRDGQLPVEEAVRIARDVADALHAAHGQGVIHRDIKPANVLLSGGRPLLADFGIALAVSAAGGGRMTSAGMSLGTPYYMSPEQASAERDPNAASDVYSLACVLYEMLVGEPPFTGSSVPAVLAKILTGETPVPMQARPSIPANVDAAIRKGLERLSADRFTSAQDFARALSDPGFRYATEGVSQGEVVRTKSWNRMTAVLAAASAVLAVSTAGLAMGRDTVEAGTDAPVVSFVLDKSMDGAWALGPDGSIAGSQDGVLVVRRPGELEASQVLGTENESAFVVTLSPDGTSIAFIDWPPGDFTAAPLLKRVPTVGGTVQTLWTGVPGGLVEGLHWGEHGSIYFGGVPDVNGGGSGTVWRVPEVGGTAEALVELESRLPRQLTLLPEAHGLLFSARGAVEGDNGVWLLDLASGETTLVVEDGFDGKWSPTGHLIYGHETGSLFALPFDPEGLVATGPATPILEGVAVVAPYTGNYALSRTGTLVYQAGEPLTEADFGTSFFLVELEGVAERLTLPPVNRGVAELSPDGRLLVYVDHAVVTFDLDLGSIDTLYSGPKAAFSPVWSPDGSRVAYAGEDWEVYVIDAAPGAEPVRLAGEAPSNEPTQWLDDETVLFSAIGAENSDVFSVPADGSSAPTALLEAAWAERSAIVSPDGRWIAYASDRTGTDHWYVRTWPDLSGETQVSEADIASGGYPVWSWDSNTLYYQSGQQMYAATLDTRNDLRVVDRRLLPVALPNSEMSLMDIHPDGRLLIGSVPNQAYVNERWAATTQAVVVTNWFTVLRRRLGT